MDVIPDVPAGSTVGYNKQFLVAGTTFDFDAWSLSITPETFDLTEARILAASRSLLEGRLVIA